MTLFSPFSFYKTFPRRFPPGPANTLRSLRRIRKQPLRFMYAAVQKHGDIVKLGKIRFPAYLFVHPDHVKDILITHHADLKQGKGHRVLKTFLGEGLLTSNGEAHRQQRRMTQPEFHRKRIASFAKVIVQKSQAQMSHWIEGQSIDMAQEMKALSLKITVKTLFELEMEGDIREIDHNGRLIHSYLAKLAIHPLGLQLSRLPLPATLRFKKRLVVFDRIVHGLIRERQASRADAGDLLSMLVMLTDSENENMKMSMKKIRDQAITFLTAGHETTANALTWAWYLLAQHPHIADKAYAEIRETLGDRPASYDDLPKLSYIRKVFREALRLYPPVWSIGRTVVNELEIGGYRFARGNELIVCQYITQRDPRWFADPEKFMPERWTDEFMQSLPRCAYFPFGAGPRQCIGEAFAWAEGVLVLAVIMQQWQVRLCSVNYVADLRPQITLSPQDGMPLILRRR